MKDNESAERLKKRRENILNELFSPNRPLEVLLDHADPPPVWVPAEFLRRFFSCTDPFETELRHDVVGDVIKAGEALCEHGQRGLHPRIARKGKLLPRVMYETIVGSLCEERAALLSNEGVQNGEERQDGFVVSPSENMFCQECVDEFHLNTRPKLDLLEDFLFLYDELDTKSDDAQTDYEAGTVFKCEGEKCVYLVARKFCSTLRDHIKQIMKKVSQADADSFPSDDKLLPNFECVAEGIEALDMKDLAPANIPEIDKFVNTAVTCKCAMDINGSCDHLCLSYTIHCYRSSWMLHTTFETDCPLCIVECVESDTETVSRRNRAFSLTKEFRRNNGSWRRWRRRMPTV